MKAFSSDPSATAEALDFDNVKLYPGPIQGDLDLRRQIASFYDQSKVEVTADDVVISNGTTGALLLIFYGLIAPGDHVVAAYPAYEGLIDAPRGIGAEISYWRMDPNNDWKGNIDEFKSLLRPDTKMIILNNPHNPTGSVLSTSAQAEIIKLAAEHNIIVFTDEIFRPLFHSQSEDIPSSMVEHGSYQRTVVAGSLSKVWGLSGVRIGWVVTRDPKIREAVTNIRKWAIQTVSSVDETIAKELLSERLKGNVLSKTLSNARTNIAVLEKFAQDHKGSFSVVVPKGAATAFAKFTNPNTGEPVDDIQLCTKLKHEKQLLLSPGSLCFGPAQKGDFVGYVRIHMTIAPDKFKDGFERIGAFLKGNSFTELPN